MSLIRFEPFRYASNGAFHPAHFDRLFGNRPSPKAAATDWTPAVDISEEKDRFVLHADLPGVAADDIEITAEDGILTLKGSRRIRQTESNAASPADSTTESADVIADESAATVESADKNADRRVRIERASGRFVRRFSLPDSADTDAIQAHSSNGVLEISIPKQARIEPRRIAVNAG